MIQAVKSTYVLGKTTFITKGVKNKALTDYTRSFFSKRSIRLVFANNFEILAYVTAP